MGKRAMDRLLDRMTKFLPDKWAIRIVVICSLAAHLVLALFAGIRRRKAFSWRRLFLWLAYQLAGWAPTYALGHLSVGSTSRELQLVAFWAPFLLVHLGGPDNIGAYSLDDNILSWRGVLKAVLHVVLAIYVSYKHICVGGGGGALLLASTIMLVVGVAKYVERAFALRRGDLGSIRSSSKKQQPSRSTERVGIRRGRELDNEEALLFAHNQIDFWRRAMVDSSVDTPKLDTSRKILSLKCKDMCKAVEMELSLMYDILYTKAAVIHTWCGYIIRVLSPPFTFAAFLLFCLYNKECQRRADVNITYALLVSAFVLDVRWLLRALVSTWTHAFLHARPRCWLNHAFLCTGRWRRLRRYVASMDPGRLLLLRAPSSSYIMWSGTIGQYNLLHECTHDTTSLCSELAKLVGLENGWNDYHYSEGLDISDDVIKGLVFERIQQVLKSTYSTDVDEEAMHMPSSTLPCAYSMEDIRTSWGQAAARRRGQKLRRFVLAFGREFQEDVLLWHIATQVFLLCSDQQLIKGKISRIKALSEYLMFLVVVRPYMLPGLVLGSLYEETCKALEGYWNESKDQPSSSTTREEKLARFLRDKKDANSDWGLADEKTRLVSDAADLALELLQADQSDMPELLELVFNVWVDKLLYAGTRCSRDSHAKQLSRGGELTTFVWITAEHAGPFRIGQIRDKTRVPEKEPEGTTTDDKRPDCVLLPPGCGSGLPPPGCGLLPPGYGSGLPPPGFGLLPPGCGSGLLPPGCGSGLPPPCCGLLPPGCGSGLLPPGCGSGLPPPGCGSGLLPPGCGSGLPPPGCGLLPPGCGSGLPPPCCGLLSSGCGSRLPPPGCGSGLPPPCCGLLPSGCGSGLPPPSCGLLPNVPKEAEGKKKKGGTTTDDKPNEARKDTREKTRRYATLYPVYTVY